jgi:simple sugar transport system substrate-binding protein
MKTKGTVLLAVALSGSLAMAGCASQNGGLKAAQKAAAAQKGTGGGGIPGLNNGKRFTIAMVTHESPGDTFWDKIRSGAQAAAAKDGVNLKYSNDPDASKQAALIQNAVTSKVDGIATTLATPDSLAGAVKGALSAKIPVVAFNSGIGQYKQLGAMMYFGSDENLAGATVGQNIAKAGGHKPLCVIQAAGSVALEARCAGVKKGVSSTENIQVNGLSIPSVTSTIAAKLAQDKSIDWIVTLGAPIAMAALQALQQAGRSGSVKLATFDLNADAAKAIQNGQIQFSVDQQPFLQGYLAVDSLWAYLVNGNDIGGGQPVLTGPSIVDKSNIAKIAQYATRGTR